MTLEEAVAEFEAGWEVCPELGSTGQCPTGDFYITIVNDQEKPEGERICNFASSPDKGAEMWLAGVKEYAEGRSGVLFWREKPVWDWHCDYTLDGRNRAMGVVYSRLVLSETDGPW